jgi:hypothetical protein
MKNRLLILYMVCCLSCIGVDVRDAAVREAAINVLASGKLTIKDSNGVSINKGPLAFLGLMTGEKQLVTVEYFNQYGVKEEPTLTWTVAVPSIASVTANEITALSAGTTFISAFVGKVNVSINLTVVANSNAVASVMVAAPSTTSLQLGQTIQLSALPKDISNNTLSGKTIVWFTENASIVSVSSTGLATAVANGTAEVHAKVDGVKSNSIKFNVGATAGVRTGTFVSAGGYSSVGTVTMEEVGSKVIVKLSSNFQASVALGTFIYLANSTTGGTVKTAGLELGQWSSGAATFDVPGVTLNQYKYVVVLCKPAGVTFGFAELKP